MIKKTEVLTNNNEKFNELLLSIQQETAYKVIKESLGTKVYDALNSKNFIDLIIAYEDLKYSKKENNKTKKLALSMIEDLIQKYDLKNFKSDLFNFSLELLNQDDLINQKEFTKYYNRLANKIRNYVVLKFLDTKALSKKDLKEVWDELNSWYKNLTCNKSEYFGEQWDFYKDHKEEEFQR